MIGFAEILSKLADILAKLPTLSSGNVPVTNTALTSIDGKIPAKGATTVANSTPVNIASDQAISLASEATVAMLKSATDCAAVTKSDSTVLTAVRALYIGTGGDLVIDIAAHTDVTFKAVPAGTLLAISPTKVKAATAAADIVALY